MCYLTGQLAEHVVERILLSVLTTFELIQLFRRPGLFIRINFSCHDPTLLPRLAMMKHTVTRHPDADRSAFINAAVTKRFRLRVVHSAAKNKAPGLRPDALLLSP
jgi:hypothetical protein